MRKNDAIDGKRTHIVVLDLLKKSKISGATVWTGIGGYMENAVDLIYKLKELQ